MSSHHASADIALPIDALRGAFEYERAARPVVVSAPTGSGKSTQLPRWCRAAGRVLVVEPRRVACRSLAVRVAELEGQRLGAGVGYRVRDDDRAGRRTQIIFATPGVVLRMLADDPGLAAFATVVIDEFHERSLDVDLLLALLARDRAGGDGALVVMSATLDGDRIADHLEGIHLAGEGRMFPVEERYLPGSGRAHTLLPDEQGLERRIVEAVRAAEDDPGDILVFLPGKAEIAAAASALRGQGDLDVVPLHGGLTLDEQSRAFAGSRRRKVILATNVAETSLTLPGIGVVIDSGLVRRTRYHGGRGFLTLLPIAADSAAQRAGRAGRTAAGICYRLWSPEARLRPSTPPEIHRESLVPLVLSAAACGARVEALPFLDPPHGHAVEAATEELRALGAVDAASALTGRGRALFGLPLDPPHGRLLVEAEQTGALGDAIDLVAALAVGRPLFRPGFRPDDPRDDLRGGGCDAVAFIRAVRIGQPDRHGLVPFTVQEARRIRRRLRRGFGLSDERPDDAPIDRRRLAETALAADPRSAHVARRRKKSIAWSNGGTEIELGRESAVARELDAPRTPGSKAEQIDGIVVFETRAIGVGARDTRIIVTCAMPVPIPWLVAAEVGRERVARVSVKGRGASAKLVSEIERVHARKVLGSREAVPEGQLARDALARVFLEGRLWKQTRAATADRLEARALHAQVERNAGRAAEDVPSIEDWVAERVAELGVASGEDLALLSPDDLLADDLPAWIREQLDKVYPREIKLRDIEFAVRYELARKTVVLEKLRGSRRDPPPLTWLPRFEGLRIVMRDERGEHPLRSRR